MSCRPMFKRSSTKSSTTLCIFRVDFGSKMVHDHRHQAKSLDSAFTAEVIQQVGAELETMVYVRLLYFLFYA